ncbi:MAG TPA: hypothetical protein VHG71_06630 [Verrucomicrobiae bacterium]|nr:hypothetical protein [Verrucomicrobiae bacterium]
MTKFSADILRRRKNRSVRLSQYQALCVGFDSGLVSLGMAAWLLDLSREQVRRLILAGRLLTVQISGQRLVRFDSVLNYVPKNMR